MLPRVRGALTPKSFSCVVCVLQVGGNFGWYTLYSLALGCSVVVVEPVPAYQEVLRLGVSLNPGFAARTTLLGAVVYDR